jgi:hypothetical protein
VNKAYVVSGDDTTRISWAVEVLLPCTDDVTSCTWEEALLRYDGWYTQR